MPRRRFVVLTAIALLALLSACGDSVPPADQAAGPVRRIVSLAPSHTELLFALGAGDLLVGRSKYCDRPPAALALPALGDAKQVNLEAIAALDPDLVLANAKAVEEMLAPLAHRVRVRFIPSDDLGDLLDAVTTLGDLVDRADAATALRAQLQAVIDSAKREAIGHAHERVLVVVQRSPFFVAGRGSYVHELLELLGYVNAAGAMDAPWPSISAEALITLAPDAIVDAAPDAGASGLPEAEELRAFWAPFMDVPAVAHGRVRRLVDDAVVRPGPELKYAIDVLARSIAPQETPAPGAHK